MIWSITEINGSNYTRDYPTGKIFINGALTITVNGVEPLIPSLKFHLPSTLKQS